ncbi:MAG TPA: flagellar biosynthesis anti-sigma factor FlgM [Tepidisphaeraceae bacterium]|jgi:anti-sigma28 factor (negative regulator of flagellin synthesis)
MNPINNIGGNSPIHQVTSTPVQKQVPPAATAPGRASLADRVELSGAGSILSRLKANDIRADKVAGIKAQIEAGTYEDDHKLDIAADRLLDDLTK